MKKHLKYVGRGLAAMSLLICTGAGFAGCGKNPNTEAQVMTLSVNPGVEFIVDEEDKVVSVTASNEDGAYILNQFSDFTGMSAKDAALKFLELSEEYGFVVEGYTDGETFTISVSGAGAQDLYNDVKAKIQTKATELGLEIGSMVKIAESKLEEMIEECYQEYTEAEIAAMDEEKLLELLQKSREETKGLFTDEQRLEYYKDRAKQIFESRISAINEYINDKATHLAALKSQIEAHLTGEVKSLIQGAYETIDTQFNSFFADVETLSANYIAAKQEYLDAVDTYKQAVEAGVEPAITAAKTALDDAKAAAEAIAEQLETARAQAKENFMNAVKTNVHTDNFSQFVNKINGYVDDINTLIQNIQIPGITIEGIDIEKEIKDNIDSFRDGFKAGIENPWGTPVAE